MPLTNLILRLVKGSALTWAELDGNFTKIKSFVNALESLFGISFNSDGTIKSNTVTTASLQDRAVTQQKLAFNSPFYVEDSSATPNLIKITFLPYATAYAVGMVFDVKVANTNTGAVTLQLADTVSTFLAAATVNKRAGSALSAGDILAGEVIRIACVTAGGSPEFRQVGVAPNEVHGAVLLATPGANSFVVPAGVYSIRVTCGGGGGGGGWSASQFGGGGGGVCVKQWPVNPGDSINYTIGAGGAKASVINTAGSAQAGGNTTFNTTQIANGGAGGTSAAGGSFSGGDFGFTGMPGTYNPQVAGLPDRCDGGRASYPASLGSYALSSSTTEPARYGGGGVGDQDGADPTHHGTDGASGFIEIEY